ncbi:MAG: acetate--CoA ligase family protein [Pseudomonadota bacterium]
MQNMFYPKSVMVCGVSDSPDNLGRNIIENLDRFSFSGSVYLVSREGGELNGRKIHKHIENIEAVPDLAVLLIPAKAIPDALERCGRKGISRVIIQSGGFSEFNEGRLPLEENLLNISRRWNIRFMGPNCIGIINLDNGLVLPFFPILPETMKKGAVSIIAQSGGMIVDIMRLLILENIGFNKALSIGNKLDLNECDYLELLISDPETRCIAVYLENFSDGRRLMSLAQQTDKPIVVLKANRSSSTHQIARFHTTALAGDDDVAEAALKQAGVHRVRTIMEMAGTLKIFSLPLMKEHRIGVVCRSGGQAVTFADAVHRHGFTLAGYSDRVFNHVRKEIRAGVIRMTNPLDLGDVYDIRFYEEIIERVLQEPEVDGVVFGHTYTNDATIPPTQGLIRATRRLSQQYGKPVVFFLVASREHFFALRETHDFPIFTDPEQAVQALAVSQRHHGHQSLRNATQPLLSGRIKPDIKAPLTPSSMSPETSFRLLRSYGLPVADFSVITTIREACDAAEQIGYPVALKNAAPEILHKTEVQGVHLNLKNRRALTAAFRAMNTDRVLVQKMSAPGREVMIGGRQDREFGPVILFGLGGIFVEVIRDVSLRICPIDPGEAGRMIEDIKGFRILQGFRKQPPADLKALKNCLVKVSRILVEHSEVQNLDINPMLVFDKGQGCLVVDVKIQIGGD